MHVYVGRSWFSLKKRSISVMTSSRASHAGARWVSGRRTTRTAVFTAASASSSVSRASYWALGYRETDSCELAELDPTCIEDALVEIRVSVMRKPLT